MKYLTDSKIKSLYFDFDANNILSSQDLILELEKLEEDLKKYTLRFVDVSSFKSILMLEMAVFILILMRLTVCMLTL